MFKQTKYISAALFLGILLLTFGSAFATVPATGTTVTFMGNNNWQFEPVPSNLNDLDHSYAYTWGIDYTLPAGQFVDFASITFTDINNWQTEPNVLYVNLLDSAANGVASAYDGEASGNFFGSTPGAQELFQYVDNDASTFQTYTYNFNAVQLTALNTALADNNFGIGFDPDCHYFNKGIKMDITTKVVPEPISCVLFVVGSGVLGGIRRFRRS
jgi:hypothetical protein